jgi:glycosyltransferase involved in cell wall biosynthesis
MNIIVTGGFEANFSVGFVKGLVANGVDLLVVSCDETAPRLTAAGIANVNLRGSVAEDRPWRTKLTNLISYYAQLLGLLLRHRGATVHFTGMFRNEFILWEGLGLSLCFRWLAGRYIYTVHNVIPHGKQRSRWYQWLYRRIYQLPHLLLAHTNRTRVQLMAEFGVPEDRIRLTSIGLNEEMPTTSMTSADARGRLGLGQGERCILFFGKIDEYKGLDLLLESFERLKYPMSRLIIAGTFRNPGYRAQILSQLERMSPHADVCLHERFIPNEEAEVFFKACDILCLPYRHIYQSGLVFLGPRFGIPIVATDVGSLRELLSDGLGLVTSSNDVDGITHALGSLLSHPERFSRTEIIHRAQKYQWARVCQQLLPLYAGNSQTRGESGALRCGGVDS